MSFISKIEKKQVTIGVIGLGYVGLPLVLGYSGAGHKTLGLDIDSKKIECLSKGASYIQHISDDEISAVINSGMLAVTSNMSRVSEVDALIICVPTPLDKHYEPDLSYVIGTIESLLPYLKKGQIVSLESTTYPGTTSEELQPRIESRGFEIGKDIFLVYSPEREDPGNQSFAGVNIPKVVGGTTSECAKAGIALYGAVFSKVVPVSSTQVAEFTKLLENIYRAVNIGLVNELKIAADAMGIDIWEVINAAATKPFGFKAFFPGPGLGGHCIPIDPFYLTWKAREFGVHTRFIELAGEINRSMPQYVIKRTMEALNDCSKSVKGSKILVLGLSYKENVDDMRESPSFELLDGLKDLGAEVDYYDPHIPVVSPTREHAQWTGVKSVSWTHEKISSYDCVVISTNHKAVNLEELRDWSSLIIDTRNAFETIGLKTGNCKLVKA
jgi:UDP-N-acetyl-D-glucosamine dehydrogenase